MAYMSMISAWNQQIIFDNSIETLSAKQIPNTSFYLDIAGELDTMVIDE
jgi:hypothetical protein